MKRAEHVTKEFDLKTFIRMTIEVIVVTLVLSLLSYFNILSDKIYKYMELLFMVLILYFNGIRLGNTSNKYSFLEGIKIGGVAVITFILLNMIFEHEFNINLLIYYLIIFLLSVLGSMKRSSQNKKS